jgi:hypothetical protein
VDGHKVTAHQCLQLPTQLLNLSNSLDEMSISQLASDAKELAFPRSAAILRLAWVRTPQRNMAWMLAENLTHNSHPPLQRGSEL